MAGAKVIPGLNKTVQPAQAVAKPRKRSNKKPKSEQEPVAAVSAEDHVSDHLNTLLEDVSSPAEGIKKRLRAAYKKKQRIESYADRDPTTLNEDQIKALEGRPVVEAVIKELEGALQTFDEGILTLVQTAVNKALERERAETPFSNVTQFIALNDIYSGTQNGILPPRLPEQLQNATGQEVASVRLIHDAIFNKYDASKLSLLVRASSEQILPGVTYQRLIELSNAVEISKPETTEAAHPRSPSEKVEAVSASSTPPTSIDGDEGDAKAEAKDNVSPAPEAQQPASFVEAVPAGADPLTESAPAFAESALVFTGAPAPASESSLAVAPAAIVDATPASGAQTPRSDVPSDGKKKHKRNYKKKNNKPKEGESITEQGKPNEQTQKDSSHKENKSGRGRGRTNRGRGKKPAKDGEKNATTPKVNAPVSLTV